MFEWVLNKPVLVAAVSDKDLPQTILATNTRYIHPNPRMNVNIEGLHSWSSSPLALNSLFFLFFYSFFFLRFAGKMGQFEQNCLHFHRLFNTKSTKKFSVEKHNFRNKSSFDVKTHMKNLKNKKVYAETRISGLLSKS